MFKDKSLLIVFCISFLGLLLFGGSNYYLFNKAYDSGSPALFRGVTINSPDNEYYIDPPDNWLDGIGWRRNPPVGDGTYFRRTPGYSLVYLFFEVIAGKTAGLYLLMVFQLLLHFIAVYCIYKICGLLGMQKRIQIGLAALYGFLSWFYIYAFYSITEGLSVPLMVFYTYFLLRANYYNTKRSLRHFVFASFFIGAAIMIRPVCGIAGIALLVLVLLHYRKEGFWAVLRKSVITGLIPFLMLFSWGIRNYSITGEWVFLEKADHPESIDCLKIEYNSLWNFTKSWGEDGAKLHDYNIALYFYTVKGDTSEKYLDDVLTAWPTHAIKHFGKENCRKVLHNYRRAVGENSVCWRNQIPMPSAYSDEQLKLKAEFDSLRNEYKNAFPLRFFLLTPVKYLKDLIFHSNTSAIYLFQKDFQEITLISFARYFMLFLHVVAYFCVFINLILLRKRHSEWILLSVAPFLVILFFILYFQALEQRYMLPFLPFIFIGLGFTISFISKRFQQFALTHFKNKNGTINSEG